MVLILHYWSMFGSLLAATTPISSGFVASLLVSWGTTASVDFFFWMFVVKDFKFRTIGTFNNCTSSIVFSLFGIL